MKKNLLLATILLYSIFSFAFEYEYVNDQYCVYRIDIGNQIAEVMNFYSEASTITIPASFVYKGDKYIVTSLGYNGFQTKVKEDWYGNAVIESYGKYSFNDYEKNRASIVELNLPNTIMTIYNGAFEGMTRLKKISIPSKVKDFSEYWFKDNARLESIIFEGAPHICHEFKAETLRNFPWARWDTICLDNEDNNPQRVIDSVKYTLTHKSMWGDAPRCPRLLTIEVLPLKDYLFYQEKLDKSYALYLRRLNDTISSYQQKLMSHPYYIDDNKYFSDKNTISKPYLTISNAKESYAIQTKTLKDEYSEKLTSCREKYQLLVNDMENICKKKNPELYAEKYCALHPDFSEQIDLLLNDYKCKYTKNKLAKLVLLKNNLGEKCQVELWNQYSYLYKDKETFLTDYNKYADIKQELSKREGIYNGLRDVIHGNTLLLRGLYNTDNNATSIQTFRNYYDKMQELGIPISKQILSLDSKASKEYEKNGIYFESLDEFFNAYITSSYSRILKEKKKAK